jgi:hypothetical protein
LQANGVRAKRRQRSLKMTFIPVLVSLLHPPKFRSSRETIFNPTFKTESAQSLPPLVEALKWH